MVVIWSCTRFHVSKTSLGRPSTHSSFPTDCSKACPLLQFFFVRRLFYVLYVLFVLSLFLPYLSFFWCLWKAMLPGCGIPWISSLISLNMPILSKSQTVTISSIIKIDCGVLVHSLLLNKTKRWK